MHIDFKIHLSDSNSLIIGLNFKIVYLMKFLKYNAQSMDNLFGYLEGFVLFCFVYFLVLVYITGVFSEMTSNESKKYCYNIGSRKS